MLKGNRPPAVRAETLRRMARYPVFWQKIWLACAAIPRGQTRSYGWVAKAAGYPGAARAAGRALAANPFAPEIPCHRVIRADGKPGGFSAPGGLAAKKRLLKKEGVLLS